MWNAWGDEKCMQTFIREIWKEDRPKNRQGCNIKMDLNSIVLNLIN
jgi:hypothetical protein